MTDRFLPAATAIASTPRTRSMTFPRTVSHIGISGTDLDRAVESYTKTLGWYVIVPASEVVSDDTAIGVMCNQAIYSFAPAYVNCEACNK